MAVPDLQTKREGTTKRTATAAELAMYRPPLVKVGQQVLWFEDRFSKAGFAAQVTAEGDLAIALAIFVPGAMNLIAHTGVRHITDPNHEIIDNAGEGVWDFVETANEATRVATKEIAELRAQIAEARSHAAELESRLVSFEKTVTKMLTGAK